VVVSVVVGSIVVVVASGTVVVVVSIVASPDVQSDPEGTVAVGSGDVFVSVAPVRERDVVSRLVPIPGLTGNCCDCCDRRGTEAGSDDCGCSGRGTE
jgi:hypothetical protein